jgi:peptidoglycan DL-endopeptidase RipA
MTMTSNDKEPRFAPVLRGYDRQQVDDYVARLRRYAEPRFAPALRGYDRQQVDNYVARVRRNVDDAYNRAGAAEAELARRDPDDRDQSETMVQLPPVPLNQPVSTAINDVDALGESLSKVLLAALKEAGAMRAAARKEAQRITEEARLRARDPEGASSEAEQLRDESMMIQPAPVPVNAPVTTAIKDAIAELDALRDSIPKVLLAALKEARTVRAAARDESQRITEEARLRAERSRTEAGQVLAAARTEAEQVLARGLEQSREQASLLLERAETQAAGRLAQIEHDASSRLEQTRARLSALQVEVAEMNRRRDEGRAQVRRLRALLNLDEVDTTTPPASRSGSTTSALTHKLDLSGRTGASLGHAAVPIGSLDRARQAIPVGSVEAGRA